MNEMITELYQISEQVMMNVLHEYFGSKLLDFDST